MKNLLQIINIGTNLTPVNVQTQLQSNQYSTIPTNIKASGANLVDLSNVVTPDTYGTLTIQTDNSRMICGEVIRMREMKGFVDFAFPTSVQ